MTEWAKLDSQMRAYSPFLRDDLRIAPPESNTLASTISAEINSLPRDVIQDLASGKMVQFSDRLDELILLLERHGVEYDPKYIR